MRCSTSLVVGSCTISDRIKSSQLRAHFKTIEIKYPLRTLLIESTQNEEGREEISILFSLNTPVQ